VVEPADTSAQREEDEVHQFSKPGVLLVLALSMAIGIVACGNDDVAVEPSEPTAAPTAASEPSATEPPDTTVADTVQPQTSTTIDESWRSDATAWCEQASADLAAVAPPSSNEDVARFVGDFIALADASSADTVPDWPAELAEGPYALDVLVHQQRDWIGRAEQQLAAGNVGDFATPEFADTAWGSIDFYLENSASIATVLAIHGVRCGPADPALIAQADLNVPIADAWQLETGFGSVWVSSRTTQAVHRIDPDSGEEVAVIDMDSTPVKLQPANGRMIVRTDDAYVAIDPATNAVVGTLAKADVGMNAGRSWAVDDALWICDGQRLHRYEPTTFAPVTTVELGFDCGQVLATDELVIPWTYDQDPGESGTSVAAFIDPATNRIEATVDLPADVNVPIVLDDQVLFPPRGAEPAVVVDRATWSVTSRADFGEAGGSQAAYDGTSVYVITVGNEQNIAVVDPETYEITETIPAFEFSAPFDGSVNSIASSPGAVWVVNSKANLLQRFDRET
jgi:hypothetical protein